MVLLTNLGRGLGGGGGPQSDTAGVPGSGVRDHIIGESTFGGRVAGRLLGGGKEGGRTEGLRGARVKGLRTVEGSGFIGVW